MAIKALNGFYSDLPTRWIKSTQRALLSQIADITCSIKPFVMATYGDTTSLPPKVLSVQPAGAPGFKMERWATDLAKSIQGLCESVRSSWGMGLSG